MIGKFQNKYRISSTRLKNWDYGQNGAYFITICTGNREHLFGEIVSVDGENEMQFNEIGELAHQFWSDIPKHFPFIELGNYIIMPNHVHGILIINKTNDVETINPIVVETLQCNVSVPNTIVDKLNPVGGTLNPVGGTLNPVDGTLNPVGGTLNPVDGTLNPVGETLQCNVSTGIKNEQMTKISPKSGTISSIIRSYKSVVAKYAHFIYADFSWQERFHDHIIRNSESFEKIQNYIANNVQNWKEDKFYN